MQAQSPAYCKHAIADGRPMMSSLYDIGPDPVLQARIVHTSRLHLPANSTNRLPIEP